MSTCNDLANDREIDLRELEERKHENAAHGSGDDLEGSIDAIINTKRGAYILAKIHDIEDKFAHLTFQVQIHCRVHLKRRSASWFQSVMKRTKMMAYMQQLTLLDFA